MVSLFGRGFDSLQLHTQKKMSLTAKGWGSLVFNISEDCFKRTFPRVCWELFRLIETEEVEYGGFVHVSYGLDTANDAAVVANIAGSAVDATNDVAVESYRTIVDAANDVTVLQHFAIVAQRTFDVSSNVDVTLGVNLSGDAATDIYRAVSQHAAYDAAVLPELHVTAAVGTAGSNFLAGFIHLFLTFHAGNLLVLVTIDHTAQRLVVV